MRTVIFDLDGTLADTSGDLLAAANAAFALGGFGRPLGPEDAPTALIGGRAMLRLGLGRLGVSADEARLQAMYADLIAAYEGDIARRTRLYPGAAEAVGRLRASGARVGICTNKPVHLAHALLGALGVREWFHGLIGAGSLPVRKPDPAPLHAAIAASGGHAERACLIGDTDTDRETGRAAGVPVVLVTFGPHGGDVARHAPEALLSDYGDLEATLSRIGR